MKDLTRRRGGAGLTRGVSRRGEEEILFLASARGAETVAKLMDECETERNLAAKAAQMLFVTV